MLTLGFIRPSCAESGHLFASREQALSTRSGRSTSSQADICRESRRSGNIRLYTHRPSSTSITLPTMTLADDPSDRPTLGPLLRNRCCCAPTRWSRRGDPAMDRRLFTSCLALGVLAAQLAKAQQARKTYQIGYL